MPSTHLRIRSFRRSTQEMNICAVVTCTQPCPPLCARTALALPSSRCLSTGITSGCPLGIELWPSPAPASAAALLHPPRREAGLHDCTRHSKMRAPKKKHAAFAVEVRPAYRRCARGETHLAENRALACAKHAPPTMPRSTLPPSPLPPASRGRKSPRR